MDNNESDVINPLSTNASILYPLKTTENRSLNSIKLKCIRNKQTNQSSRGHKLPKSYFYDSYTRHQIKITNKKKS